MLQNRVMKLDEDYDENKDLKEFYESNLPVLFTCSMYLVDYPIIKKIAVKLTATESYHEDWRLYATEMGIDNETIEEIYAAAFPHRQLEIFFAMDKIIRKRGTFGNIIQALLNTDRFDVLKAIEPFVRSLVVKISNKQTDKIEIGSEEYCFVKNTCPSLGEYKCKPDSFQQHSISSHFKNSLQISDSLEHSEKRLEEIQHPSAPEEEKLTVLIPHAEPENDIAEQLSNDFKKEGVIPTTLTQVNNLTLYDPESILNTVYREVDFIVPILSNRYMEEIYSQNQDSIYIKNNKYLHRLFMNEYRMNNYFNFKVRPVIVPETNRRKISEPIFSHPFRLDKEVPKLIEVLKETKYIIKPLQLVQ